MCGIAGILSEGGVNENRLRKMASVLAHRGPDGEGVWLNDSKTASFAHRRLAIIDLSEHAAQPMRFKDRYTIVFNGEIYNHPEIRNELRKAGYRFMTQSDTEVILAAYDVYKHKCLHFLDGMFAFAIWDEVEKTLFAARDRFGEKPFYYFNDNPHFVFASEMKALWAAGVPRERDERMLLNYLALGHLQNPADKSQTFFSNIAALPPSHYLVWHQATGKLLTTCYWDVDKRAQLNIKDEDALSMIDSLLNISIIQRLRSDVPVGSSLSGGVDSTAIAWYINHQHTGGSGHRTFSAVFPDSEADESLQINEAAQALSLQNDRVIPTGLQLAENFEKMSWHQEEPISSSSIFAQFCVHQLASKKGIKVLLEGQGADEIFAGYSRYAHWYIQDLLGHKKFMASRRERKLLQRNGLGFHWGPGNIFASFLPSHAALALEKREYRKVLHHPDITHEFTETIKGREWEGISKPYVTQLNDILYFNTFQMGLEELLRFSDRNSMANGIEVRLPFLQPDLVEFLFSLPPHFKIRNGFMKWVLRKLMDNRLPDSIVWQKRKVGFEPPQKQWMQLPEMIDLIFEARKKLVAEHILKPSVLEHAIIPKSAHQADNYDWRYLSASTLFQKP